jgi:formyl-CoA transferase
MAMYDCMVAHTTSSMPHYQATGEVTSRARENMFTAQLALRAQDGYVVLAGGGDVEKWKALWTMIGRDELIEDNRYLGLGVTGGFYFDNVVPAIEAWSENLPKQEVNQKLLDCGFSMGIVQNTADLDNCPQLAQRKMFVESGDGYGGKFRTVNTPLRLTGCPDTPDTAPPLLSQDSEELLCSIGGLSKEEFAELKAGGKI